MSPPDGAASVCDVAQATLHALLLDREPPVNGAATDLWAHVAECDRCACALAHDQAMRRALERLRGRDRAPKSLHRRVQRIIGGRRAREDGSRST